MRRVGSIARRRTHSWVGAAAAAAAACGASSAMPPSAATAVSAIAAAARGWERAWKGSPPWKLLKQPLLRRCRACLAPRPPRHCQSSRRACCSNVWIVEGWRKRRRAWRLNASPHFMSRCVCSRNPAHRSRIQTEAESEADAKTSALFASSVRRSPPGRAIKTLVCMGWWPWVRKGSAETSNASAGSSIENSKNEGNPLMADSQASSSGSKAGGSDPNTVHGSADEEPPMVYGTRAEALRRYARVVLHAMRLDGRCTL